MRSNIILPALLGLASAVPYEIPADAEPAAVEADPLVLEGKATDVAVLSALAEDPTQFSSDFDSPDVDTTGSLHKRAGTPALCQWLSWLTCLPLPVAYGPRVTPDTADAFMSNSVFSSVASNAVAPSGYTRSFQNLNGATSTSNYLGYSELQKYDASICTALCDATKGCVAANIYYERDPSVSTDPLCCPNPASVTRIKCSMWGTYVTPTTANNNGQYRDQFQVVMAGSNGYNKQVTSSSSSSSSASTAHSATSSAVSSSLTSGKVSSSSSSVALSSSSKALSTSSSAPAVSIAGAIVSSSKASSASSSSKVSPASSTSPSVSSVVSTGSPNLVSSGTSKAGSSSGVAVNANAGGSTQGAGASGVVSSSASTVTSSTSGGAAANANAGGSTQGATTGSATAVGPISFTSNSATVASSAAAATNTEPGSPVTASIASSASTPCATPVQTPQITFNVNRTLDAYQILYMYGSIPQLGSWSVDQAVLMSDYDATTMTNWFTALNITQATYLEYKYFQRNADWSITWPPTANRVYTVPTDCQSQIVVNDAWPQ